MRKLFSITRSASVAVVSEIAPMWMTASSLRPSSQRIRSAGATTSATWRLAEVAPLVVGAEHVVDDDVGAPGLVEGRDHIRADETGPAGDQKHSRPMGSGHHLPQSAGPRNVAVDWTGFSGRATACGWTNKK